MSMTKAEGVHGLQFITNVVFIPYMALREQPPHSLGTAPTAKSVSPAATEATLPLKIPYYAPFMGAVAAVIGLVSIAWVFVGRPEYGGLVERQQYFVNAFTTNRVFFAFFVDLGFYTTWQAIFLRDAARKYRFVPFAGLAAWLIAGGPRERAE